MRAWIGAGVLALASCTSAPKPPPSESAADNFPKARPPADAAAEAVLGHGLFVESCIRCHRVNGQGGHTGPELNHPRNVTEAWDDTQLRALIQNPRDFGLNRMPAFLNLSDSQVNALIDYLKAMKGSGP